ncbi:MAG: hypothetical protein JWO18_2033 [Microbacteriaceae bacterium]|nr:hypothetical protein [Microbacteriaceae bacterium]
MRGLDMVVNYLPYKFNLRKLIRSYPRLSNRYVWQVWHVWHGNRHKRIERMVPGRSSESCGLLWIPHPA